MEKKGLVVKNIPPVLPAPSSLRHSSSRAASLPAPSSLRHSSLRGAESLPGPSLVGHSSSRGAESNSEQEAASDTGYEEYYQR